MFKRPELKFNKLVSANVHRILDQLIRIQLIFASDSSRNITKMYANIFFKDFATLTNF